MVMEVLSVPPLADSRRGDARSLNSGIVVCIVFFFFGGGGVNPVLVVNNQQDDFV